MPEVWGDEKVIILGRGMSLKRVNELPNIKTVILCNLWWENGACKPYYKDEMLYNYLKDKEIILVTSPLMRLTNSDLKGIRTVLNIKESYFNSFSKNSNHKRYYAPSHGFKPFPDEMIQYWDTLYTKFSHTGSLGTAMLLAIYYYKKTDIYLCGLDFYQYDYYISNNFTKVGFKYVNDVNNQEHIQKCCQSYYNFFNYHKTHNFSIYTLANYNNFDNKWKKCFNNVNKIWKNKS